MKAWASNKVLGLAIGERSLLAAEVLGGDQPRVRRLGEFIYPQGLSLAKPQELGAALKVFLHEGQFTASRTMIGLPAQWLLVKSKQIPRTDPATTAGILRLQAESEFSSDLKDLSYDYLPTQDHGDGQTQSILLIATPGQYIQGVTALCRAAGLNLRAVLPQGAALASAASEAGRNAWILHQHNDRAELSARSGGTVVALRAIRSGISQPAFGGELRRALSSVRQDYAPHELLIWRDETVSEPPALGQNVSLPQRQGKLDDLGVAVHLNGTATGGGTGQYAPAVALALSGLARGAGAMDFLHSRLAPPKTHRIPRWAFIAAAAVILLIAGVVVAWHDLQQQQTDLQTLQTRLDGMSSEVKAAQAFVAKVSLAQHWHGGQPQYLQCLRDLTLAMPADGQTYATNLIIRDPSADAAASSASAASSGPPQLRGQLFGKTNGQEAVQGLIDRLKRTPAFTDVKLGGTQNAPKGSDVSFSINFTYFPHNRSKP